MAFKDRIKDTQLFYMLYLINGASYDQSVHETHIISHNWPFSLPYKV